MQHDPMFWKLALPEPKVVTRTNKAGVAREVVVRPADTARNRNKRFGRFDFELRDEMFHSRGAGVVYEPHDGRISSRKAERLVLDRVASSLHGDRVQERLLVASQVDHDKQARIAAYKSALRAKRMGA